MKKFIKYSLINTRNKHMATFDYQYERDDGDIISLKGHVNDNIADFEITRTKANGHKCSSVPVQGMPLINKCINEIAEIAVEAL